MTRKDDKGDQPSGGETTWTKYWSDTIWQRTAQDRLTWRGHAEAFSNRGTQRLPNDDDDDDDDDDEADVMFRRNGDHTSSS